MHVTEGSQTNIQTGSGFIEVDSLLRFVISAFRCSSLAVTFRDTPTN
jgi:hypothetical protein